MFKQVRSDNETRYDDLHGKSCFNEIWEMIAKYNVWGRALYKPMRMQPLYKIHRFVTEEAIRHGRTGAYVIVKGSVVGADIFQREFYLLNDIKMTVQEQDKII